jgi:hypothetical protein
MEEDQPKVNTEEVEDVAAIAAKIAERELQREERKKRSEWST